MGCECQNQSTSEQARKSSHPSPIEGEEKQSGRDFMTQPIPALVVGTGFGCRDISIGEQAAGLLKIAPARRRSRKGDDFGQLGTGEFARIGGSDMALARPARPCLADPPLLGQCRIQRNPGACSRQWHAWRSAGCRSRRGLVVRF